MKGVGIYDHQCRNLNFGLTNLPNHHFYSRSSSHYPLTPYASLSSSSTAAAAASSSREKKKSLSRGTTRLIHCAGGGSNSNKIFSTTRNHQSQPDGDDIKIEAMCSEDDGLTFEDISAEANLSSVIQRQNTDSDHKYRTKDSLHRRKIILTAAGSSDINSKDPRKNSRGNFTSESNTYYEDYQNHDNKNRAILTSGGAVSTTKNDVANKQESSSSKETLVNYQNLPQALFGDTCSALLASFLVSPMVCAVDKSIMQQAAGTMSIPASMANSFKEMIIRPGTFFRRPEFLMIWGVYALTYITANYINTFCELRKIGAEIPRFLGTTVVNMSSCIAKDYAFVRMFGSGTPKPLSLTTLSLFTVRDSLTVLASFNLPEPASLYMQRTYNFTPLTADNIAQLTCPIAVQIFSTPLHLYGLDLYNRPNVSLEDRLKMIFDNYRGAAMARMMRILPAFGIGGIGNKYFRNKGRSYLQK